MNGGCQEPPRLNRRTHPPAGWLTKFFLAGEGDRGRFKVPVRKPKNGTLTVDQQACGAAHGALRCLGERASRPPTKPYVTPADAPGAWFVVCGVSDARHPQPLAIMIVLLRLRHRDCGLERRNDRAGVGAGDATFLLDLEGSAVTAVERIAEGPGR